jgi:hypothetical protein
VFKLLDAPGGIREDAVSLRCGAAAAPAWGMCARVGRKRERLIMNKGMPTMEDPSVQDAQKRLEAAMANANK